MIATRKNQKYTDQSRMDAHPVKVTALEYIGEAVRDERYEELKDMVDIAREFGADEWEIWIALTKNIHS